MYMGQFYSSTEFPKLWDAPHGGAVGSLGGGAQGFCTRIIFILKEIWTQDKIYILVGTLLG
jgi:hypothetical protein